MFLLSPSAVLDFLSINLRSTFVMIMATTVLIHLWLLILLAAYIVYKRLKRLVSRINNEKRSLSHMKAIFAYLHSNGVERPKLKSYDRLFFRRLVLMQMTVEESETRKLLQKLYRDLGYYAMDLRALSSRFWWVKLAAAVRLETVALPETIPLFTDLIEDSNDLISLVAFRAVSRMDHYINVEAVLDALSRRAPARRDVFIELLNNFAENHADQVLQYLKNSVDPYIAAICIDVLGQNKVEGSLELILPLLKSSDDGVVEACLRACTYFDGTESIDRIRPLLSHESGSVRAQALRSLQELHDPQLSWAFNRLKDDPSVPVQKAVFELS